MAIATIEGPSTVRAEIGRQLAQRTDAPTVLFVDTVGSAVSSDRNGDTSSLTTDNRQIEQAFNLIQRHHGTIFKTIGDSLMAEFFDPISAVRAGIEIERLVQQPNVTSPLEKHLDLRIGIHACVGSCSGIDLFGDSVNWAVGITKRAAAGQILISRPVYEMVSREPDLHCQWFGKAPIYGRTEEEDVFEVGWAEAPLDIPARYEVLSQIGSGGMGMVYKVQDLESKEIVALKVLKPGIASDPAMQENLRREVCLARKVTHKNVCRIHEFNRSNGTACISMEFIEGESLSSKLHRLGPLPLHDAIEIARQICDGLREAHVQGIVHRDLKPANIIVDRNGSVKIMDFGIARLVHDNSQVTGTISGTPAYMSPEQVELKNVDARTDIYAMGLLLYEMTTGCPAFFGDNPIAVAVKQIRDFPMRPREIVPALTARSEAIIWKCLQKDPGKRFQSVDELDLALKQEVKTKPAVGWGTSIVPKLRRAGLGAQQVLCRGIREARPALTWWASKLRSEGRDLQRIARGCSQRTRFFLRRRDWREITTIRSQQALAGLGLVLVLGGAIAFALGRGGSSHGSSSGFGQSSVAFTVPDSAPTNQTVPVAAGKTSTTSAQQVDLNRGSGLPSAKTPLSAPMLRDQRSTQSSTRVNFGHDNASRSRVAAVHQPQLAVLPHPSSLPTSTTGGTQTVEAKVDTLEVVPLPLGSTLSPTDAMNESKPVDLTSGLPLRYLDVGSFKDAAWADSAVEKLSQLGFQAVSVQKGHLWAQSYHVQVGPYTGPKAIEDAQQSLASHGFKSHLVK